MGLAGLLVVLVLGMLVEIAGGVCSCNAVSFCNAITDYATCATNAQLEFQSQSYATCTVACQNTIATVYAANCWGVQVKCSADFTAAARYIATESEMWARYGCTAPSQCTTSSESSSSSSSSLSLGAIIGIVVAVCLVVVVVIRGCLTGGVSSQQDSIRRATQQLAQQAAAQQAAVQRMNAFQQQNGALGAEGPRNLTPQDHAIPQLMQQAQFQAAAPKQGWVARARGLLQHSEKQPAMQPSHVHPQIMSAPMNNAEAYDNGFNGYPSPPPSHAGSINFQSNPHPMHPMHLSTGGYLAAGMAQEMGSVTAAEMYNSNQFVQSFGEFDAHPHQQQYHSRRGFLPTALELQSNNHDSMAGPPQPQVPVDFPIHPQQQLPPLPSYDKARWRSSQLPNSAPQNPRTMHHQQYSSHQARPKPKVKAKANSHHTIEFQADDATSGTLSELTRIRSHKSSFSKPRERNHHRHHQTTRSIPETSEASFFEQPPPQASQHTSVRNSITVMQELQRTKHN